MKKISIFALLILSSSAFALQPVDEVRPVVGGVQFWTRTCNAAFQCELPTAVGGVQIVQGEITKPDSPSTLGEFSKVLEQGDLRLEFHIFWKNPLNEKPHLVYQQRLLIESDGIRMPIGECSNYVSDQTPRAFPVGACTGYQKEVTGFRQWGASFIKAE